MWPHPIVNIVDMWLWLCVTVSDSDQVSCHTYYFVNWSTKHKSQTINPDWLRGRETLHLPTRVSCSENTFHPANLQHCPNILKFERNLNIEIEVWKIIFYPMILVKNIACLWESKNKLPYKLKLWTSHLTNKFFGSDTVG